MLRAMDLTDDHYDIPHTTFHKKRRKDKETHDTSPAQAAPAPKQREVQSPTSRKAAQT